MEKNKTRKKTYKSFAQWEEAFFPKKTEERRMDSLLREPKSYGVHLANNIVEGVIKKKVS